MISSGGLRSAGSIAASASSGVGVGWAASARSAARERKKVRSSSFACSSRVLEVGEGGARSGSEVVACGSGRVGGGFAGSWALWACSSAGSDEGAVWVDVGADEIELWLGLGELQSQPILRGWRKLRCGSNRVWR